VKTLCTVILGLLAASPATAAEWKGTVEPVDGVPHVMNPAAPRDGVATLQLEELWRLGGNSESDDEFFGVVTAVRTDAEGNVYLLDSQLSEVKVFDADGAYLRTIGREGEGPGEFRRPFDIAFTPSGDLGVFQMMPGKIVQLTTAGDPDGEFPLPVLEDGARRMLRGGALAGDRMIVFGMDQKFGEGKVEITSVLSAFDAKGNEVATYFTRSRTMNFGQPEFDERKSPMANWSADAAGTVYAVPDFGDYRIHVWNPDGSPRRVIERAYEHRMRTPEEIEEAKTRIIIRGPVDPKITVADYSPDIAGLYAMDDGTLWVATSRGRTDDKPDYLGTFDVFDGDGRFVKQVALQGEGNSEEDGFVITDDRVFVLRHLSSARSSMWGADNENADDDEEVEPMAVICYRLDRSSLVAAE